MNVNFLGSRVIADDQVKMRSLRWVLIQYDWCPCKKGTFGHRDRHAHGENTCEDGGREWGDATETKEHQRLLANHQKMGDRNATDCPSRPSERTSSADTLILDF